MCVFREVRENVAEWSKRGEREEVIVWKGGEKFGEAGESIGEEDGWEGGGEREREGKEQGARQSGLRRGREKRGVMRCGRDLKNLMKERSEWVCALKKDKDKR